MDHAARPPNEMDRRDFRIESWLVQPGLNRISSDEASFEIEPLVMHVLVLLAERPGEVVSREELMDAVWPDAVVGDKSLTNAVSKLRKVLGDDPFDSRIIQTVSKNGYSLIAPVDRSASTHPGASGFPKGWIVASAVAVVAVAGGLIAWTAQSGDPAPAPTRLTSTPGHEINPSLSPDGKFVAYAWGGPDGDQWDIFVKPTDADQPIRRTTDAATDLQPAWSPDGAMIAFTRYTESDCGIYLLPAFAGDPYGISDCAGSIGAGGITFFRPNLAWSPDGESLVIPYREDQNDPWALFSLSISTLQRARLTDPKVRFGGDVDPKFSPDGRYLAFSRIFGLGGADLFVLDLEDRTERRLTNDHRYVIGMEWMPDARSLIFSSERNGTYDLWQIATSGGRPVWFPATGRNLKDPSIAANGLMVYEDWSYDDNLWRVDLSDSASHAQTKVLGSTLREIQPAYSSDGSRIAFMSNRTGDYEIWVANRDGSGEIQLTTTGSSVVGSPRWSSDDRLIAFEVWIDGQADLQTVDVETRRVDRLTDDPGDDVLPSWSPDDRRLTFTSNRSGDWQIWIMEVDGGGLQRITSEGGYRSHFAGDSDAIFHSDLQARGLWRVARGRADARTLVVADLESGDWGNWQPGSRGIYYVLRGPNAGIAFFDIQTGGTRMVAPMERPPAPGRPGFTVDPQGRDAVFSKLDQTESDLVMMRFGQ